jgi:serine/threonine protein kinase
MQIEITPKGHFQSIDEFKIVRDVGVGSFGRVKLAVHRGSRKQYAIKVVGTYDVNETSTQI